MIHTPHIACNQYAWQTFIERDGYDWASNLEQSIAGVRQAGFDGFEPIVESAADLERLIPLLRDNGLSMRSLYVNSTLHRQEAVQASIDHVLAIADAARALDTAIMVTNPSPIRWGGPEDKTDAELETQAAALNQLGAALRAQGQTLSYHAHDAEFRNAAREFHHMLVATDPAHVTLCLDPDWIYRGAGFSTLAIWDIIALYGARISQVHLRQSNNRVWCESLGPGDIDLARLFDQLATLPIGPHWVLEQAVSPQSAHTLGVIEAQSASVRYVLTFEKRIK